MRRSWLKDALFGNLLLKLVSLGLAVLIFVSVRAEKQSLAYGTVRVSFTPPPGRALVSDPPDELQVSVLGPTSRMPRFRFEDIADVSVDLASVPAGYLKFRPDMIHLSPEFSVASIRPAGFRVEYAKLVTRRVPIRVSLEGQVAAGYSVAKVTARPADLSVSGAEGIVAALSGIRTRPVAVEGARASIVAQVGLLPLPTGVAGQLPKEVEVSVEIGPLTPNVVLSGIPVVVDGLEPREAAILPERVDVTVAGPPEVLANLTKTAVVARVVLQGEAEAPEAPLGPRIEGLPAAVSVRKITPATVLVRVRSAAALRRARARKR